MRGRRRGRPARRGHLVPAADAVVMLGLRGRHHARRRGRERAAGISQRLGERFEFRGERQDTGAMIDLVDCRGGMQKLVRRGAGCWFGEHGASVAPIAPRENGVRRASPARPLPSATRWGRASGGLHPPAHCPRRFRGRESSHAARSGAPCPREQHAARPRHQARDRLRHLLRGRPPLRPERPTASRDLRRLLGGGGAGGHRARGAGNA